MADGTSSQSKLTGTPAFTAPELVSGNAADPFAADVWALGACLFCFIYGRVPFQGGCVLDVFKVCESLVRVAGAASCFLFDG
jgi:[calcium/calmodulin-dependent protein kinase] kinase